MWRRGGETDRASLGKRDQYGAMHPSGNTGRAKTLSHETGRTPGAGGRPTPGWHTEGGADEEEPSAPLLLLRESSGDTAETCQGAGIGMLGGAHTHTHTRANDDVKPMLDWSAL